MRIYMLVLTIIVVFSASEVFGMGKSDGSKEEVKSSVSEPAPAAAPKPAPIATPKAAPVRTPRAARVAPPKAVGVASPAPKTVLVTVNGIVIRQSDVNKEVAPQKSRMAAGGRPIPDSMVKQMEQRVVQMLVEKQIVKDKIASEGI
ncbi:MAG: hypothetical protein KAR47_19685, partial [Planctomycetes bacterium]|nr:hypothetical protein [Planctomycetota bacterium]